MNLMTDNTRVPFLLESVGKDYLWGGSRLNDDFGKEIPLSPLAETWECSTHPDGTNRIRSGPYAGALLSDVLKEHPEMLGTHPRTKGELPILVKLIDAASDLSVQVHPDDAYAAEHENGSLGKSEMWYVLDAKKDAKLVYGFRQSMTTQQVRSSIAEGTIEHYLQKVPVNRDDIFYVEAGTVHAIGAGALLAEIQESSNLTYRLFDYDRVDAKGNRRELHIEKALQVARLEAETQPRQPMRVHRFSRGCARELLCRCRYFQVERMTVNTEVLRTDVPYETKSNSFHALLCIKGCGTLISDEETIRFFKGDCIFVPAESSRLSIHAAAEFLDISC